MPVLSPDLSARGSALGLTLTLGLIVGAAPRDAGATVVRALEVEQLVALSDLVIEGQVGTPRTRRDPAQGQPITDTPVQIFTTLHGTAPASGIVNVRQLRGMADGRFVHVAGDPQLSPGDRVILMLRKVDGHYYLTALGQAAFWVRERAGAPAAIEQRLSGLVRMEETADGPVPVAAGARPAPQDADALRARIRAAGGAR